MNDHDDFSSAREFWSYHTRRQSLSGLSVRSYCLDHDLVPGTFYFWRRKLQASQPATFTELRFPPATAHAAAAIELHHPCGVRISLAENFSPDALRRVLDVLSC